MEAGGSWEHQSLADCILLPQLLTRPAQGHDGGPRNSCNSRNSCCSNGFRSSTAAGRRGGADDEGRAVVAVGVGQGAVGWGVASHGSEGGPP